MKKTSGFEKFYKSNTKKGAAKKEEIRKEKRLARKEREERIKKAKASRNQFPAHGPKAEKNTTIQPPKYNLELSQKSKGQSNKIAPSKKTANQSPQTTNESMPLNKYIA